MIGEPVSLIIDFTLDQLRAELREERKRPVVFRLSSLRSIELSNILAKLVFWRWNASLSSCSPEKGMLKLSFLFFQICYLSKEVWASSVLVSWRERVFWQLTRKFFPRYLMPHVEASGICLQSAFRTIWACSIKIPNANKHFLIRPY